MTTTRLKNKHEVAKRLAGFHFKAEGGLVKIFHIVTATACRCRMAGNSAPRYRSPKPLLPRSDRDSSRGYE
jgi:hypothetical protein